MTERVVRVVDTAGEVLDLVRLAILDFSEVLVLFLFVVLSGEVGSTSVGTCWSLTGLVRFVPAGLRM